MVVDVLLLLGRKQQYLIVLFTLHALLNAIIRCLQLNTGRCRGCNPEGGLLVIDAVGLTVYVFCVMSAYLFIVFILEIIVQGALSVNCPSVIRLPSICYFYGETPLVNCGSRSYFLNITAILYCNSCSVTFCNLLSANNSSSTRYV